MSMSMRFPTPMKGRKVIGFGPITGHPKDAEGRIIIDWIYAPKGSEAETDPGKETE